MPEAVKLAVRNMPDDYVIKSFLERHRSEVEGMLDTEYNEAEIKELFIADGRREGRKEGEDLINRLNRILIEQGRIDDLTKSTTDKAFQYKLIEELIGSEDVGSDSES